MESLTLEEMTNVCTIVYSHGLFILHFAEAIPDLFFITENL